MVVFIADQDVLHPETCKPLIEAGKLYSVEYIRLLATRDGVDNIEGEWYEV